MKLKTLLLSVAIMGGLNAFSQKNYIPAKVINQAGDTVRGFINYRNWLKNPDEISFAKNAEGSGSVVYTPLDIKGFVAEQDVYLSGIVQIETSSLITARLDDSAAPKLSTDTLFLRQLFKGVKPLYIVQGGPDREYFYIPDDGGFSLLIYKKYKAVENSSPVQKENKKFLGQLKVYLSDCASIQSHLNRVKYESGSMQSLFNKYAVCLNPEAKQNKSTALLLEISAVAGVTQTKIDFVAGSTALHYLADGTYNPVSSPSFGISLDLVIARNQQKWSVNTDILYTSYDIKGHYENVESSKQFEITNTDLAMTYLKLHNMVRYKHPIGNAKLYFNAGISTGQAFIKKNTKTTRTVFYSDDHTETSPMIDGPRTFELGFVGGIGVKYKKAGFEARYDKTNGMSPYKNLQSNVSRLYLLLSYRLK
jgi:hypothetical protein